MLTKISVSLSVASLQRS